jgi:hypothetical protein
MDEDLALLLHLLPPPILIVTSGAVAQQRRAHTPSTSRGSASTYTASLTGHRSPHRVPASTIQICDDAFNPCNGVTTACPGAVDRPPTDKLPELCARLLLRRFLDRILQDHLRRRLGLRRGC